MKSISTSRRPSSFLAAWSASRRKSDTCSWSRGGPDASRGSSRSTIPSLAFPVIDGSRMGPAYPDPSTADLAREAGFGSTELALLVVVAVLKGKGLVANLLAPLIVDLEARLGVQVVLDPRRYSAVASLVGTDPSAGASQAT